MTVTLDHVFPNDVMIIHNTFSALGLNLPDGGQCNQIVIM